jgi:hypothetical protein
MLALLEANINSPPLIFAQQLFMQILCLGWFRSRQSLEVHESLGYFELTPLTIKSSKFPLEKSDKVLRYSSINSSSFGVGSFPP